MHGCRPDRVWRRARLLPLAALVAAGALACAKASTPPATDAPQPVAAEDVGREVRALLAAQVDAWNRGDVEGFMAGYWRSSELRFVSGGEVTHGWEETLERYRRTYPDRATMGTLSFEGIDVRTLGEGWAAAHGRYVLEREGDRPTGLFTLLLERRSEGWRIVHDHTSSGP
ncbi:MAG TPA: SgcJ/EcaC family oxidoreductase [Thermoanaerobaculia bacterium]|nr:SgcJ/EcaC family oxidoreductase [Thermoanaerobaculia bacterium]